MKKLRQFLQSVFYIPLHIVYLSSFSPAISASTTTPFIKIATKFFALIPSYMPTIKLMNNTIEQRRY